MCKLYYNYKIKNIVDGRVIELGVIETNKLEKLKRKKLKQHTDCEFIIVNMITESKRNLESKLLVSGIIN